MGWLACIMILQENLDISLSITENAGAKSHSHTREIQMPKKMVCTYLLCYSMLASTTLASEDFPLPDSGKVQCGCFPWIFHKKSKAPRAEIPPKKPSATQILLKCVNKPLVLLPGSRTSTSFKTILTAALKGGSINIKRLPRQVPTEAAILDNPLLRDDERVPELRRQASNNLGYFIACLDGTTFAGGEYTNRAGERRGIFVKITDRLQAGGAIKGLEEVNKEPCAAHCFGYVTEGNRVALFFEKINGHDLSREVPQLAINAESTWRTFSNFYRYLNALHDAGKGYNDWKGENIYHEELQNTDGSISHNFYVLDTGSVNNLGNISFLTGGNDNGAQWSQREMTDPKDKEEFYALKDLYAMAATMLGLLAGETDFSLYSAIATAGSIPQCEEKTYRRQREHQEEWLKAFSEYLKNLEVKTSYNTEINLTDDEIAFFEKAMAPSWEKSYKSRAAFKDALDHLATVREGKYILP